MREVFQSLSRNSDHVSQKPLSTRSLPMRRHFFVLALLACCVPAGVFAGNILLRLHELRFARSNGVDSWSRRQPYGHCRRLVQTQ